MANRKGQTIMSGYVITFFLVIGAVVAMMVYMQRAFQARIRDAKIYMVDMANHPCDADCHAAIAQSSDNRPGAGARQAGDIAYEYEPYYGKTQTLTNHQQFENTELLEGGSTGIFRKQTSEQINAQTTSEQLPPKDAN